MRPMLCDRWGMAEKFGPSLSELAEYERAAMEVTRLRRKGIPCHMENHPDGTQCHVDVVRDDFEKDSRRDSAMRSKGAKVGR